MDAKNRYHSGSYRSIYLPVQHFNNSTNIVLDIIFTLTTESMQIQSGAASILPKIICVAAKNGH